MANLVSAAEFKAITPVAMADADLDSVIERVEAEITEAIGAPYEDGLELTETLRGGGRMLFLLRPISALVSVTESDSWVAAEAADAVLAVDADFVLWPGRGQLERIGGRATWDVKVVVVYTPLDQRPKRKQAIIDLTRIVLATTAYQSETVGNAEYTYRAPNDWEAVKRAVFRRLQFPMM